MNRDDRFDDWKRRADQCDLLATAVMYGAKLKRAGREHVGPCVACAGTDRFSINPSKNLWHCRGHGGGHGAIGMSMHVAGLSFLQACEALTGEPNPNTNRPSKPLSAEEQAARNRQRQENDARQRVRQAQEEQYQEDTKTGALNVLKATVPMINSECTYLVQRGLKIEDQRWFESVRFHPGLRYALDGKRQSYPCMVSRVQDLEGSTVAIQSVYLNPQTFKKAALEPCKVTTGPCGGGAVRLGGIAPHIYVCEGVETGIAISLLTNFKAPVWCTLGTSGLVGLEVPLSVSKITIWPDGDKPFRKRAHDFEPTLPAGRAAAIALQARQTREGVECAIASEPGPALDYADLWKIHAMEIV